MLPNESKLPPPPRMSADEKRLALMWHAKDGMGPTAIGDRLRLRQFELAALGGAARPEPHGQAAEANEAADRQVDQTRGPHGQGGDG